MDQINKLLPSLKVEKSDRPFRCCNCNTMQFGRDLVWVPDGITLYHSMAEINAATKMSAHFGGWCSNCAARLGKPCLVWKILKLIAA